MLRIIFKILLLTVIFSESAYTQIINAPTEAEAEPENYKYIKVKWNDNSNNEEGFYIERSYINDTSAAWEIIGSAGQNGRSFFDYWVTNNVTYYYRVYAYAGNNRSGYSNIAFATAVIDTVNIPAAPSNLVITDTASTSITIQWTDNSLSESGFIIARRTENEMVFSYIDTVGTDILTYQEVGLTPDVLYFYKVCAYNSYGLSDFSNTVSAVTKKSTNIVAQNISSAESYFLGNNFPNPFNPTTNIRFGITERSFVKLTVYNSLGVKIEELISQYLSPGIYLLKWNAEKYSSGVYFYGIETNGFTGIKKMILIK